MTAVANTTFTAAQFNTYVRDNLLETAPAKATTAGRIFVATGANVLAERQITSATVTTSQTTTSTSYTDLATSGPAVTVTTGTLAMVMISCQMSNSTTSQTCRASFAVSVGTTTAAADEWCLMQEGAANDDIRHGITNLQTVTGGSNTFTMKYRVGANTGTFDDREIVVMAL